MFGAVQLEYSQPDEIDQDLNRPIYSVIFFLLSHVTQFSTLSIFIVNKNNIVLNSAN